MIGDELNKLEEYLDENLKKWFDQEWVRFGPDGKIRGDCARDSKSEGKPKCLPKKKAKSLGKKGRKYAASKKRREDPNANRKGKAKNVSTKKKTNEGIPFDQCPHCRGPIVHETLINEKKDACYHKVKSRYKVWPSAYASGALVQCRKKGASNWGNKSKKNESSIMKGLVDENDKMQGSDYDYSARVIEHIAIDVWRVVVANKNYTHQYSIKVGKKFMYDELINAGYTKAAEQWKRFMQTDPKNGRYFLSADGTYTKNDPLKTKESSVKNESAYEADLDDNEPRVVIGVYGAKSKEFRKKFANQKAQDRFFDHPDREGNYEIHYVEKFEINESVIVKHDMTDPEIAVLGGAGTYKLSNLKKKAFKEALQLADDIKNGKYDASSYNMKQLHNTLNTIVAAEKEMEKKYFGEDYTGMFAAEKTAKTNPYGGQKDRQFRGDISETPTDNPTGASGEGGWRKYKPKTDDSLDEEQLDEKCWKGYKQVGMKKKDGKKVPNCVPKESAIMRGLKR